MRSVFAFVMALLLALTFAWAAEEARFGESFYATQDVGVLCVVYDGGDVTASVPIDHSSDACTVPEAQLISSDMLAFTGEAVLGPGVHSHPG